MASFRGEVFGKASKGKQRGAVRKAQLCDGSVLDGEKKGASAPGASNGLSLE